MIRVNYCPYFPMYGLRCCYCIDKPKLVYNHLLTIRNKILGRKNIKTFKCPDCNRIFSYDFFNGDI